MANVKNFGLVGVGGDLQFGKAGTRLINNAGVFNFKAADGSADSALTAAGITSSAGNVTLTTGNVVLSSQSGKVSIGGVDVVQRSTEKGLPQISGTTGVVIPAGATVVAGDGEVGAIRINTSGATSMEYHNGTAWVALSSSASNTSLQNEVDALELTLGTMVNTDGTTNVAAALTHTLFDGATDLTTALTNLAAGVASKDTLDEILPGSAGQVIYNNAGTWAVAAPGTTSGVQAWDAGLDALSAKISTGIMVQTGEDTYGTATLTGPVAGLTITNGNGVAGNPTFALANDLAALEALSSTGFAVRSADDTWVQRSLVAPAAGFTIADADGVAGNPTFALANDLAALEGLTTTGYIVRTANGSATTRALTGTVDNIVVTNGDGVSSDTTIDLATVTQASSGDFVKVTLDTYGRVTGNTAVTTADITALVDSTYVNVTGDAMTGNLDFGGAHRVVGLAAPVDGGDAVNKSYVDSMTTGLTWKNAVRVMADINVDIAAPGATIDGTSMVAGDRVLLIGQTADAENGIYVFNGAAAAMTRSSDADVFSELAGAAIFVMEGTFADSGFTQTTELADFTGQLWSQFAGGGAYSAGTGLDLTGTTFTVKLGAGIADLPTGEVGIDLRDPANGALILTTDGLTRTTDTAATLHLLLDATGGLEQTTDGLKIAATGVTNAMLLNSTIGLNADAGTNTTVALGQTLEIIGTATKGISTSLVDQTVTITAADATASQKGVASFDATEFSVSAGAVTLGKIGNSKLANSTITVTGTAGSDAVALGENFAIVGADSMITTTMGANSLSIQLATVDVPHGGTGLATLAQDQLLVGNGTAAVAQYATLTYTSAAGLTVGGVAPVVIDGATATISATATNSDLVLMPNGTGSVIVGPVGDGLIQSDAATALTVRGNTVLTLESGTGSTVMKLASGATAKVSVDGPTAVEYATGLAANDLVNKEYVDAAIQSGAASGSIKAVKVAGATAGTVNLGAAMPAGSTVLSVKVVVTSADATGTVSVGKTGAVAEYMTTAENDPAAVGIYMAECYVTETAAEQVIATITGSGTYTVIAEYQVA